MIQRLIISKAARNILIHETSKSKHAETGGVLCGHYINDTIIITSASGPGPHAVRSIDEFVIDEVYMQHFLDREYEASEGLNIYVGEWHTHPERNPHPSLVDVQSIYERTLEWKHGDIVFIIIGFIDFSAAKIEEQIVALCYEEESDSIWEVPIQFQEDE